jgi:hypothetical protein
VLLDATVPHRFCEAQLLLELITYLRDSAWVTPEVMGELRNSASGNKYVGLRALDLTSWPKVTDVLPPEFRGEYADLKRAAQQPGDPPEAHIGEITTVLMAAHLNADVVVIDDRFGKALVRRKLPAQRRLSTAQLALEMVQAGSLSVDEGFAVFDCTTDETVGRSRYDQALRNARP